MGKRFQLRLFFLLMGAFFSLPLIIVIPILHRRATRDNMKGDICWRATDTTSFECWIPSELLEIGGKFESALKNAASDSRVLYLVVLDTTQVDLALNLYAASFKPLEIKNVLFACADRTAADLMFVRGIECYGYPYPSESSPPHEFREMNTIWRTEMKTKLVLSALLLGYAILHLEVDVIVRHDILPLINSSRADLILPVDYRESPFAHYYAKPTEWVKELHIRALELQRKTTGPLHADQFMISRALVIMEHGRRHLPVGYFDPKLFPSRTLSLSVDETCSTCAIVHSIHSQSIERKIYHFKENMLWMLDYGYYSNRNRKYIIYDNPLNFGEKTMEHEVNALKNALFLGHLLNRTVILPKFSCHCASGTCSPTPASTRKCDVDSLVKLSSFDRYFVGKYRETSFLSHPLVPRRVKRSISKSIIIKTEFVRLLSPKVIKANKSEDQGETLGDTLSFMPSNPIIGTRPEDIFKWFNRPPLRGFSILRFNFLYDVFPWPLPLGTRDFQAFEDKIKESLLNKFLPNENNQGTFIQDVVVKLASYFHLTNISS